MKPEEHLFSVASYTGEIGKLVQELDPIPLRLIAARIVKADRVYVIGNGGSMATAMHFAEDLTLAQVKSVALSDIAYTSMAGNDFGYDQIFKSWLQLFAQRQDLLFCISTSGKSPNVLQAAEYFRELNWSCSALVGDWNSPLEKLVDTCMVAKTKSVRLAEDLHSITCHLIANLTYQLKFNKEFYDAHETS